MIVSWISSLISETLVLFFVFLILTSYKQHCGGYISRYNMMNVHDYFLVTNSWREKWWVQDAFQKYRAKVYCYLWIVYDHRKSRDITVPTKVRLVKAMVFLWSCMDVRVGLWRRLSAEELMLLNCGVGEDSWESLGLQGDPTSPFRRGSALDVLWKE